MRAGQTVAIMGSMKMEHVIAAHVAGYVREFTVAAGDTVFEDHPLAFIEEADIGAAGQVEAEQVDLDALRPDLALIVARHAKTLDAARPSAVARRRKTGQRTARENIDDLVDPGTFVEYGALAVAARRRRDTHRGADREHPGRRPAGGPGPINGDLFGPEAGALHGDDLRLHGAGGHAGRITTTTRRTGMFELAEQWRLPMVFFAEGGGGRPGDTDGRRRGPRRAGLRQFCAGCQRPGAAGRRSPRAAASPATPRCSAAAT